MNLQPNASVKNLAELASPMDGSEITSFNIAKNLSNLTSAFKSPNENHFAITPPPNQSPANVYQSDDCNEIIAKELALSLNEITNDDRSPVENERCQLVSQASIEIEICDIDKKEPEIIGEVSRQHFLKFSSSNLDFVIFII